MSGASPISPISVVIAGGGTGGHVYPGLALAEALGRSSPEASIAFVGTARGMETRAVPEAGYDLELIEVLPWAKSIGLKRFLAPLSAIAATRQARGLLARRSAGVVVSMGGYASLPVALAARWARIPLVVHEQNAIPGRANVLAGRFSKRIAITFAASRRYFSRPSRLIGNPLRRSIAQMDREALRAQAFEHFKLDPSRKCVLFMGGSQGARRLNQSAGAIAGIWASRSDRSILLIAGPGNDRPDTDVARCVGFTDRMDLAYAASDLVVSRSGAGIMELACAGLPAILVPYPYARDGHQSANAKAFAEAGAAILLPESEATPERIARECDAILEDPARAEAMARASTGLAMPNAAGDLAAWVLEAAEGGE